MFDLSKNTGSSLRPSRALLLLLLVFNVFSSPTKAGFSINLADIPCGKGALKARSSRIIGGKTAVIGQFPWAVRLHKKTPNSHRAAIVSSCQVHCGGSLITARHVLTAAHCVTIRPNTVTPADEWEVVAGGLNTKERGQVRQVKSIERHPGYRFPFIDNDLAVLTLAKNVSWNKRVSPVCLPGAPNNSFALDMAELAGWGYTSMEDMKKGETSEELMYTRVRVMENPECMEWLEDERKRLEEEGVREVPPEAVPIGLNQLCTGMQDSANGGCHGDSGGPLTVEEVSYVLAGVVSGGGKVCGKPRVPSIYTRVARYADWLKMVTRQK